MEFLVRLRVRRLVFQFHVLWQVFDCMMVIYFDYIRDRSILISFYLNMTSHRIISTYILLS